MILYIRPTQLQQRRNPNPIQQIRQELVQIKCELKDKEVKNKKLLKRGF